MNRYPPPTGDIDQVEELAHTGAVPILVVVDVQEVVVFTPGPGNLNDVQHADASQSVVQPTREQSFTESYTELLPVSLAFYAFRQVHRRLREQTVAGT